jgi:hypothetical protein
MNKLNEQTLQYTATGKIIDMATSQSSASHGGSITLYHLLIAASDVEEPELLCFSSSTYANPHLPLPFLMRGHRVTVQYKRVRHNAFVNGAKETAVVGKSLELLFLDLDWSSTPYMEQAKKIAAEG